MPWWAANWRFLVFAGFLGALAREGGVVLLLALERQGNGNPRLGHNEEFFAFPSSSDMRGRFDVSTCALSHMA